MGYENENFLELIYGSIKEVNKQIAPKNHLKLKVNEYLVSDKSPIDSLGLITLLIHIEGEISKKFNQNINLIEEELISEVDTPFETIGSLAEWLKDNVK